MARIIDIKEDNHYLYISLILNISQYFNDYIKMNNDISEEKKNKIIEYFII